ncbi:MAG: response regulator [Rhodospirillaceae bacterium]|nr:response regulator [Rhodospirillaceae bacterium]
MLPLCRVAFVDDDPDIREIIGFALRDVGGFDARAWGDGRSFLEELTNWLPQMVLLDLTMPEMDGWETAMALHVHPQGHGVPVVLMSGRSDMNERSGKNLPGVIGEIAKPFDPLSLSEKLRDLWDDHVKTGG